MKTLLSFSLAMALSLPVIAQVWTGPGPTPPPEVPVPTPVEPEKERVVCMGDFGCMPVAYTTANLFTVAIVRLPNGYPVAGISGACLPGWDCPAIRDDADRDLAAKLDDLHRFKRFLGQ